MAENARKAYEQMMAHVRQAGLLATTLSNLGWDQETMMPPAPGAVQYRARQRAQLAGMVHQQRVDPRVGEWLQVCEADSELTADPLSVSAVNIRELRRDYDRRTRLPQELVERFTRTVSLARHAWSSARQADDFAQFRPHLEQLVSLNRERAECFGYGPGEHIWDALAEGFEPGMRAAEVERVFTPLRQELSQLVTELTDRGTSPDRSFARVNFPIEQQRAFCRHIAAKVGFDLQRGRLDESAHPFCCGLHRDDVRMTTRFHGDDLPDALSSTLHESGHGLYEQGLPAGEEGEHVDTPFGSSVGLSIHESQSRLIENQLGRSRAFWQWCRPHLVTFFGQAVEGYSVDDLYGSVNVVQPSLIRTESDEATYNLHIMVRFDLERAMLSGDLAVADLPGAWAEAYREYLGIAVPSDADGCLQDVHWAEGAMGYFPTYTLGNLYAAQFNEQMQAELGDIDGLVAEGRFEPIVDWLREKIHSQGRRYRAAELCEQVTGRPLDADALLRHLRGKLRPVYGL